MGGIPWHWDMEAGVKTRTLEESSPASSWMPGRKSSFPAANLMQRQILLPSISRNHNFILIFIIFLFFSPLVRCIFALLSLHLCITFFSVPQNTSQGLAAGKYNQSNSYYFSMFHTVVFLLLLVFFFFLPFSSFLSQTRTNTVRLAGNWQASTIQRQWFFF